MPAPLPRPAGRNSVAYWSTGDPKLLLIFVHGFNGDPTDTWPHFASLLPRNPEVPAFDYMFYGYDSVQQQANSSATEFAKFLEVFIPNPADLVNSTLPSAAAQRKKFQYERVLIIAHSLGAFVTRNALLREYRKRPPPAWLDSIRLLFFAPAHHGAYATAIAVVVLTNMPWFLGKLLGSAILYRIPVLQDMEENSAVIRELHKRTSEVIEEYKKRGASVPPFIQAHYVMWAQHEHVVINAPFFEDPPQDQLDASHVDVCKPDTVDHPALRAVWSAML